MTKDDMSYLELMQKTLTQSFKTEIARVNAGIDIVNVKIDDVIIPKLHELDEKVGVTNGRVLCLEDDTRPFNKKNRKYSLIGLVACMMIIGLTMAFAYHNVNPMETITNKTGIEFKVDSLTTHR